MSITVEEAWFVLFTFNDQPHPVWSLSYVCLYLDKGCKIPEHWCVSNRFHFYTAMITVVTAIKQILNYVYLLYNYMFFCSEKQPHLCLRGAIKAFNYRGFQNRHWVHTRTVVHHLEMPDTEDSHPLCPRVTTWSHELPPHHSHFLQKLRERNEVLC